MRGRRHRQASVCTRVEGCRRQFRQEGDSVREGGEEEDVGIGVGIGEEEEVAEMGEEVEAEGCPR